LIERKIDNEQLILLLGEGGYYGHSRYGGAGLGAVLVLGLVLIVLVVLSLLGGRNLRRSISSVHPEETVPRVTTSKPTDRSVS